MPHEISLRIYYEDTDAGGVVYYANYLRYTERARCEMLQALGVDIYALHRRGLVFMVAEAGVKYLRPALLGDVIQVSSVIERVGGASLEVGHEIRREGELLARVRVRLGMTGALGRPARMPEDLRARLLSMIGDG